MSSKSFGVGDEVRCSSMYAAGIGCITSVGANTAHVVFANKEEGDFLFSALTLVRKAVSVSPPVAG